jgi:hypothetical protein
MLLLVIATCAARCDDIRNISINLNVNHFNTISDGNFSSTALEHFESRARAEPDRTILYLPDFGATSPGHFPAATHRLAGRMRSRLILPPLRCLKSTGLNLTTVSDLFDLCTIDQMLADLAQICRDGGWKIVVAVGRGFGGVLAAFFRQKYPHLATAAWAASAPVFFRPFAPDTGLVVKTVIPPDCYNSISTVVENLKKEMLCGNNSRPDTLRLFGMPENFTAQQLLYELAEAFGFMAMGNRTHHLVADLCDDARNQTHLALVFNRTLEVTNLTVAALNPAPEFDLGSDHVIRLFMKCSSLGGFHTHDPNNSLRSPLIDESFFNGICNSLFGINVSGADELNGRFGTLKQKGSATIFTFGSLDIDRESMEVIDNPARDLSSWRLDGYSDLEDIFSDQAEPWERQRNDTIETLSRWAEPATCKSENQSLAHCKCNPGSTGNNCSIVMVPMPTFKSLAALAAVIPSAFIVIVAIVAWKTILVDPETANSKPIIL